MENLSFGNYAFSVYKWDAFIYPVLFKKVKSIYIFIDFSPVCGKDMHQIIRILEHTYATPWSLYINQPTK